MSSALARVAERPLPAAPAASDPIRLGEVLAASGYFSDAREAAQAAVKVMAGQELGIGPIAAMTNIHMVKGKVTVGANILAGLIKRHDKYDYQRRRLDDEACVLAFFENGVEVGDSTFTIDDAKKASLMGNPIYKAFPRNMLFARAITNGVKVYCPDLTLGMPVYTPDEMGATVNGEGEFIAEAAPAPAPARDEPPTDEQAEALAGALGELRRLEPGTDHVARMDQWFRAKYPDADPQRPTRVQTQALIEAMLQKAAVLMAAAEDPS